MPLSLPNRACLDPGQLVRDSWSTIIDQVSADKVGSSLAVDTLMRD